MSGSAVASSQPQDRVGVLVLAHGGTNRWNSTVRRAVRRAKLEAPTEVVFGMGMHSGEVRALREAVDRLERKGIKKIAVVPLVISSHSEVFRQYEYLLGLRPDAEWTEVRPIELEVPVTMGRGLDGHPVVAEVLADRAKKLSRNPSEETVILVAHGPVAEADNQRWLAAMLEAGEHVQRLGGFKNVLAFTMRDDAPKAVKDRAEQEMRAAVAEQGEHGRVLVVPLLMAPGGVEQKIPRILAGLSYAFNGETLLPHPKMVQWIAQQEDRLAGEPATPGSEAQTPVIE